MPTRELIELLSNCPCVLGTVHFKHKGSRFEGKIVTEDGEAMWAIHDMLHVHSRDSKKQYLQSRKPIVENGPNFF